MKKALILLLFFVVNIAIAQTTNNSQQSQLDTSESESTEESNTNNQKLPKSEESQVIQIDRSQEPKSESTPEINIAKPYTFQLKNGLKVYLVENHKLPRVSISLSMDNPIQDLEKDLSGAITIMGKMLGNGTKSMSKDDFNDRVEYLGAKIFFGTQSASASSLSKYFPEILGLFADATINPKFDKTELKKEIAKKIESIKLEEKNVPNISNRVGFTLSYGRKHPYAEFETEESLRRLRTGNIITAYYTRFVPTNAYMVIEGDISKKKTKRMVKKLFKPWRNRRVLEHEIPTPKNPSYVEIDVVNVPTAVQSKISIGNLLEVTKNHEDYFPLRIANYILGGGEGYLFENLREDKGYTYGAYSRVNLDNKTKGRFVASASVRTHVTDSAVVEFLREIKRIREESVTESVLSMAKAKYTGNFIMSMENPETSASFSMEIDKENLSDDFYTNYLKNIEKVTAKDVQRVAKKYFLLDNLRILIVGNVNDLHKKLKSISFEGEVFLVKYFDKYGNPILGGSEKGNILDGIPVEFVLKKYIKAIALDGKKTLRRIFSIYTKSKSIGDVSLNLEVKKYRDTLQSVEFKSSEELTLSRTVYDGKEGYTKASNRSGQRQMMLKGSALESFRLRLPIFMELKLLDSKKAKLHKLVRIGDNYAYQINVGNHNRFFYDIQSGLKLKEETITIDEKGESVKTTLLFFDYKEIKGIRIPRKISFRSNNSPEINFNVIEIKLNGSMSANDFK